MTAASWPRNRGNVYFLQVGTDGPIRIGYTSAGVRHRIRVHQSSSPHILRWIGAFRGERGDERKAHLMLKDSWLRAEWFHPTTEVLAFVAEKTAPDFIVTIPDRAYFPLQSRRRGVTTIWIPETDVPCTPCGRNSS